MQTQVPTTDSEIYTAQQLAELLGCDKETAEARTRQGDLPGVKFGKGWIVPRQAFIERVNEMAKEEAAKRREQLRQEQASAATRGKALLHPSPLLPTPQSKRAKRRAPPTLPPLPDANMTCLQ
ncbi:helix-turn-helix domain-containing protein [Comamonas testosteroni]|uniref:helix-turn-helix domain-containing protein n=1 Tax=Comamonas testosteroni TaxID=285 RepID=UPI00389A43A2